MIQIQKLFLKPAIDIIAQPKTAKTIVILFDV
jgi:hypothetical protein